jgi:hypothetical protein
MSTPTPPPIQKPPPIPARKPPFTPKQIVILVIAAVLLLLSFLTSFSVVGIINHVFTPGGLICVVVLSALFYHFRTPRDSGTADDGYELIQRAISLEKQGKIDEAIKAYEYVAGRYSHTPAGQDAEKSIQSLKAMR